MSIYLKLLKSDYVFIRHISPIFPVAYSSHTDLEIQYVALVATVFHCFTNMWFEHISTFRHLEIIFSSRVCQLLYVHHDKTINKTYLI